MLTKKLRAVLVLTGATLLATLAGCSDDDDPPSGARPPSPFGPEELWGPPGTPLPAGAELISVDELAKMKGQDGVEFVTYAELKAATDADEQATIDARNTVDALVASDPSLAYLKPVEPAPSDDLAKISNGNYELTLDPETKVVVHGTDWLYRATAESLRKTASRPNREASYRLLFDALPEAQRAGLPAPDALAPLTDAEVAAQQAEVVHRAEAWLSNETVERAPPEGTAAATVPATGCEHQDFNLYQKLNWPLKAFTTPTRSQGKRGSCVGFAVTAAIEARVFLERGLPTDYSEQELYAAAKGIWFPSASSYGDGLSNGDVLDKLVGGYQLDAERRWRYNFSRSRLEDDFRRKYFRSCDDYTSAWCSDTNHQMKVLCANTNQGHVCAYARPPGVTGIGYDPVSLNRYASLWDPTDPEGSLSRIRAHLNAGYPVVLGGALDDAYRAAVGVEIDSTQHQGVVRQPLGEADEGPGTGHAYLAVGYVSNGQIPTDLGGSGGGYLITKNSWGCNGDGGFMHLSYGWVAQRVRSAYAVGDVATNADWPAVRISVDNVNVTQRGAIKFTLGTRRATHVELFRGPSDRVYREALPGDSIENLTFYENFDEYDNGFYVYWAQATDQFGNQTVSSNIAVRVNIDGVAPAVSLTASSTSVIAPSNLTLTATATDNTGVAKVKFYRGLTLIAQDTTAPYSLNYIVPPSGTGSMEFSAIALDASNNQKMSNIVTVQVTTPQTSMASAPKIWSFSATPSALPPGGGTTVLSWNVAGAQSVKITPNVGDVEPKGQREVSLLETTTFQLEAVNGAGTRTASFTVPVEQVVVAPTIASFTATPVPGGDFTLAWDVQGTSPTLSIDQGVGDVSGMTQVTVNPTAATTYTLTATNAAGQATKSVTAEPLKDAFVSPTGNDTGNACTVEAMPCRTIVHAATQAGSGGRVWLLDGAYDATNQGASALTVPAGARLQGKNSGQALLRVRVDVNGGEVRDVVVDRTDNTVAGLRLVGGTVTLEALRFRGVFSGGAAVTFAALDVAGATVATLTPGTVTNYAADVLPSTAVGGAQSLIVVRSTATLTITGGSIDSDGAGPGLGSDLAAAAFLVEGSAQLFLNDVTVRAVTRAIRTTGSGRVSLDACTVTAKSVIGRSAYGIWANGAASTAPEIIVKDSTISGFINAPPAIAGGGNSAGIGVSDGDPTISLENATVTQNAIGIYTHTGANPTVTATNSTIDANLWGGLQAQGPMTLRVTGGSFSDNDRGTVTNVSVSYGGLNFVLSSAHYDVRLRNVRVENNRASISNGNTNHPENNGLSAGGDSTSIFDLGTAAMPGNNIFRGNRTPPQSGAPAQTHNIFVRNNVTVLAVGNTFDANTQGADANGKYALGVAPCGATSCEITSGDGVNYRVAAGKLRLAE